MAVLSPWRLSVNFPYVVDSAKAHSGKFVLPLEADGSRHRCFARDRSFFHIFSLVADLQGSTGGRSPTIIVNSFNEPARTILVAIGLPTRSPPRKD